MRIQTEVHDFEADVRLLQAVEQKISKLDNFFHRISEVKVILKSENLGFTRERVAEVKIHISNGIIFSKKRGSSFGGALSKAIIVITPELFQYILSALWISIQVVVTGSHLVRMKLL